MTGDALLVMGDGDPTSHYYDLRTSPVLLQIIVAAWSLFILIVLVTFCCCIEIRR